MRLTRATAAMAEEQVSRGLRPTDEGMCVWRESADETVLQVSTLARSDDPQSALSLARILADEVMTLCPPGSTLVEVEALSDEESFVWTPE